MEGLREQPLDHTAGALDGCAIVALQKVPGWGEEARRVPLAKREAGAATGGQLGFAELVLGGFIAKDGRARRPSALEIRPASASAGRPRREEARAGLAPGREQPRPFESIDVALLTGKLPSLGLPPLEFGTRDALISQGNHGARVQRLALRFVKLLPARGQELKQRQQVRFAPLPPPPKATFTDLAPHLALFAQEPARQRKVRVVVERRHQGERHHLRVREPALRVSPRPATAQLVGTAAVHEYTSLVQGSSWVG
ncbi:MAG: hypothetical protein ACRDIB_14160 [Ardenticatenaceae bacterium]